jgi:menaquinol-cytochrome c reductase iron-sulfur subunit|tara:strand:- start:507 stop:1022 length:516 start_codon:yes stop_codon:yes gene_type:complete
MQEDTVDSDADRRSFLTRLSVGLAGLIGAVISLPPIGYVLSPLVRKPPRKWRDVGSLEQFPMGETKLVQFQDASSTAWAGDTAKTGAWLRRTGESEFIAFSVNCRHLGCPVRWIKDAKLFMCPCHGGVYYQDGEVAAGPPPEALARYPVRVVDGNVEIETSPIPLTTNDVA